MKKIFIIFVLNFFCSGFVFADYITLNNGNINQYLSQPKPWLIRKFGEPMYIKNQSDELISVDINVDYAAGPVFLMCNDFMVGVIEQNSSSGCLIKKGGYAYWGLGSDNVNGVKNSQGTFTLYKAEQ